MREGRLIALIQDSLAVATKTGAAKPSDFSKAIVDNTRAAEGGRSSVRVRDQRQNQRGKKVYSLHAREVECLDKDKARKPDEFGVKVSVARR